MASSSSSAAAASASAAIEQNIAPAINPQLPAAPDLPQPPLPLPPPPPPAAEAHAVYIHQLFDNADHHNQIPPRRRREIDLLWRTAIVVLIVFFLTLMFSFITWVTIHPTFPKLQVASATLSNLNITSTAAAGDCNLTLLLSNPNRHLVAMYDQMEINLIYPSQHVLLSQDYRPAFVQPPNNRVPVEINLNFAGVYLGGDVMEAMKKDLDGGSLSLGIKILAIVSYRNGRWKTHSQYMRAYCDNLVFGFSSKGKPGIFSNPVVECDVYLYTK